MGKTGRQCQVCVHAQRHVVELGLLHRVPTRVLAKRFSLSRDAILRHGRMHVTPQMKAAMLFAMRPNDVDLEALERSESEGLLASLVAQRARLQMLSEMAFEEGELHAATGVERAITSSLELTSKLLGMIVQRHDVRSTSILISSDYLAVRSCIMAALRNHPEAAHDVAQALASLEVAAAEAMTDAKRPIMLEAQPC